MVKEQANRNPNPLVYNAIKDRGRMYLTVFRELKERYGEDEAISVMRAASYAYGKPIGEALACFAPRDFAGMAEGFARSPDDGATFLPDVRRLDDTCLEVQMMSCPIKDAWVEAGCSDAEIGTLLHCASALDEATLETAGFAYEIELWSPGKEGCCLTRITEKTGT
ncbi:MAG: L-2-amino-thiazoline-4-carboxylic acid hydrolase [Pseudomonadota bacterium]